MKKTLAVLLFLSLVAVAVGYQAWAKTMNASTGVTIIVSEVNAFAITSGSLIFKDLQPGVEATKTATVVVTSNAGLPWKLKMWATNLLDPAAFKYSVTGPGAGIYQPEDGEFADVPSFPSDIYISTDGEDVVQGMTFTVTISVTLPSSYPAGTYSTALNFQSTTEE